MVELDSYFPSLDTRNNIQYNFESCSFMVEDDDREYIHASDEDDEYDENSPEVSRQDYESSDDENSREIIGQDYESSDEDNDENSREISVPDYESSDEDNDENSREMISRRDYEARDKNNEIKIGDNFDLSCLFTPTRNYLIRNNGGKAYVNDLAGKFIVILGFYIPIPKDVYMASLCRAVIAAHRELQSRGVNKFEFVLVTCMRPDFPEFEQHQVVDACFNHFFSVFSCPAIPILDVSCSRKLLRAMGIYAYYHNKCLIVSPYGKVLQRQLDLLTEYGAHLYPFTDERLTQLDSLSDSIPDGGVLLENILCTDTCDVLPVPDCGISAQKIYFYNITKKYVWLYLLGDGSSFGHFLHLWSLHEDVEFVVVFPIGADMIYMDGIRDMCRQGLKHHGLNRRLLECRMSCLLQHFSNCHSFEGLTVVGPGFLDIHGADIYHEYGDTAFPFSKKLLYKSILEKVRSTTIEKVVCLLPSCLDLDGRDVFLYLGYSSKGLEWEHLLPKWCSHIKRSKPSFQFVILCREDERVVMSSDHNSWLWIPYENSKKVYEMFESLGLPINHTIYAYGADGNLLSIQAEDHLFKSTTATFPNCSYLEKDIRSHLKDVADFWDEL